MAFSQARSGRARHIYWNHVVSFFLFHELPPAHKRRVFAGCLHERGARPGAA